MCTVYLDDAKKAKALILKLEGRARLAYDALPTGLRGSYEKLKKEITRTLVDGDSSRMEAKSKLL